MSGMAMSWAATHLVARCPSGNHVAVLLMVAHHTDKHGRGCWAAQQTIATETQLSLSTVKRCLKDLAHLGLLRTGDWRVVAHLRADRRPDVWDIPMNSKPLTTGQDDLSQPLNDRSNDLSTTGQTISPRGVSVTYKPVKTEPVKTEPENQSDPASPPPPDWTAAASGVGEEVQEEGEGFDSQPADENTARAVAFVDRLPFDRNPTTAERADLVYLVGLWFKAGWSHDALMAKCEAGLDTAHDRIGAWIKFRLAADKVCKPPANPAGGHQTYKDPPRSEYYNPKTRPPSHQGFQNPTDPDAYNGSF